MCGASDAIAQSMQYVNAVHNAVLSSTHSPSPCAKSQLNIEAREWWTASAKTLKARAKPTQHRRASDSHASLQVPSNWPKEVVYLTQNLVASSIPESVARDYVLQPSISPEAEAEADQAILGEPSSRRGLPRATHNDGRPETLYTSCLQEKVPLVIWPIGQDTPWDPESYHSIHRALKCHPSAGSFGLFAAADIAPNTFIRPYLGVLHTKADADFYSTYDLSLCHDPRLGGLSLDVDAEAQEQDPTALYLDSRYWGNESRFVNDYRGIASKANVEFRSFVQRAAAQEKFQMGLFSTRPIRKGQELLINYGKSYWIHHQHLDQLEKANSSIEPPSHPTAQSVPRASATSRLDPIHAMLQRSRMRVSPTALNASRPPQRPPSHTCPNSHPS